MLHISVTPLPFRPLSPVLGDSGPIRTAEDPSPSSSFFFFFHLLRERSSSSFHVWIRRKDWLHVYHNLMLRPRLAGAGISPRGHGKNRFSSPAGHNINDIFLFLIFLTCPTSAFLVPRSSSRKINLHRPLHWRAVVFDSPPPELGSVLSCFLFSLYAFFLCEVHIKLRACRLLFNPKGPFWWPVTCFFAPFPCPPQFVLDLSGPPSLCAAGCSRSASFRTQRASTDFFFPLPPPSFDKPSPCTTPGLLFLLLGAGPHNSSSFLSLTAARILLPRQSQRF